MTRKTAFFERWSWFKFDNLRLALDTKLKFYTSVAKGLKLKVRKFWELIPTFVEVAGEKLVKGMGAISSNVCREVVEFISYWCSGDEVGYWHQFCWQWFLNERTEDFVVVCQVFLSWRFTFFSHLFLSSEKFTCRTLVSKNILNISLCCFNLVCSWKFFITRYFIRRWMVRQPSSIVQNIDLISNIMSKFQGKALLSFFGILEKLETCPNSNLTYFRRASFWDNRNIFK